MEEPTSPVWGAFLFAVSAPATSFALGLAVMWIYKGFVTSKG